MLDVMSRSAAQVLIAVLAAGVASCGNVTGKSDGGTAGAGGAGPGGAGARGGASGNGVGGSNAGTGGSDTGAAGRGGAGGNAGGAGNAGAGGSAGTAAGTGGNAGTGGGSAGTAAGGTGGNAGTGGSAGTAAGGAGGNAGTGGGSAGTAAGGAGGNAGAGGSAGSDFLTPCVADTDCTSGVCIAAGNGGSICTVVCTSAQPCPTTAFRCGALASQDTVSYCLPRFNDLCKPCRTAQDCRLTHGGSAVVDQAQCSAFDAGSGIAGSFCTTECSDTALPCPAGYSCEALTGSAVKHCRKTDQQCSCLSTWSGASTACTVANAQGVCSGTRTCSANGLTSCSAAAPAAEACNGRDDNCDGAVDEGGAALCPASNLPCLSPMCSGAAGCTTTVNAGFCVIGGACVPDGSSNPANACQGCIASVSQTAWSPRTGTACNDGDPCTTGEVCSAAGQCNSGTSPTDCSSFGSPPCRTGVCQPGVGCVAQNNNGVPCDDGLYCTVGDVCSNGVCGGAGATPRDCSSLSVLPCRTGVCSESTDQCIAQINNGTACDDGNPCSTNSACNASGTCTATSFKDCSAQNDQCNTGVCNMSTGACQKQAANVGASCDDMNACTTNGTCTNSGGTGVCSAGTRSPARIRAWKSPRSVAAASRP